MPRGRGSQAAPTLPAFSFDLLEAWYFSRYVKDLWPEAFKPAGPVGAQLMATFKEVLIPVPPWAVSGDLVKYSCPLDRLGKRWRRIYSG